MSSEQFKAEYEATRRAIREDLAATVFVEAGAGTGKTSALVDRIVAVVTSGIAVDRIVAITFTEKAAAELKDRVRTALERAQSEDRTRETAGRALRSLDQAQISTIHAFGLSLMKMFGAEAGVDPAFTVQDDMQAQRRFDEQWRLYLSELHRDATAMAALDRSLGLGLTARSLQVLATELARLPGLAEHALGREGVGQSVVWPDAGEIGVSMAKLPLELAPRGDKLRRRAETIQSLAARLGRAGEDREAVLASAAGDLADEVRSIGNQATWGTHVAMVRDAVEEARALLQATLDACRSDALSELLPFIARFVQRDVEGRRREGCLTFDDLILGPRDVLLAAEARQAIRDRYDVLLIDEFQDTDPLQVEIALAFATDPHTGQVEAGRLFLVGDAKQSIYRFRRADMTAFERARSLVEGSGAMFLALALNQRSRPIIVAWVNRVFARIIGDGERPEVQPKYQGIHARRSVELRGPGVATIGGETRVKARAMRRQEAAAIAAQCVAARGTWEVFDRETDRVRPASYRDMAVLLPTRAGLAAFERAMQSAAVPYRVEGGSLVFQTQEVRDLINCLTAIDDPADGVAVVAALRSAAFACSDVELARHRLDGGRFDYLAQDLAERDGPVADGLRVLASYHEQRGRVPLASLVERFIAERGLDEAGLLVQSTRDSFRRMRFVVEQARAFESAGPESLRAFVSWMERRAGSAGLDNEGAGLDDDEDAVRILTVHGAKGLEFSIVFMAGLSWSPSNVAPVFAVDRTDNSIAVRIGAKTRHNLFQVGDIDRLFGLEREHVQAEFARVLYVAATRARDHLVVSLHHQRSTSAARLLIDAGARDDVEELAELPAVQRVAERPFADLRVELPWHGSEEAFVASRVRLVEAARKQRYASATSLVNDASAWDESADETEPWKRGRGGTSLGRAVHATIQSLPLDADEGEIEAYTRAQAVAEAIPDRAADVERLVRAALQSTAMKRARAATRLLREVPFAVQRDGVILEGFVDMVIEDEHGIEIVDWKTDHVPAGDVPERVQHYALQAGLYVAGIEAATGRRVTQVTYVFVSAGVEVSPGEPKVLAEAALTRLTQTG
ncbi:MAG TPA: UvrD-helicase domain-containing protein [Dehalococcoidia bacterium]|nr:UvrD-helicase domain-containing protein [Dehalococcoidia bacterium]